ncbi:hypothetical protein [Halodesulfovibrio aestuarii]|uniref:Uncharacterized protein n=1 Tax=Halodesulfovibrio aestuarii TaxID=126333 RepID=A0ABV4JWL1_9BACT
MTNRIGIVIDFQIYFYLFEPIINRLINNKASITIYCPEKYFDFCLKLFDNSKYIELKSLDAVKDKHRIRFVLHRILMLLLTRDDFSFQWKKKRYETTKKYSGIQGLLLRFSRYFPHVSNAKINRVLKSIVGFCFRNPFENDVILVGSLNASSHLLCANGITVYTVMESWDHSVKDPNGYVSDCVFCWNKSLATDWILKQYDQNVVPFFPLKLRYALTEVREQRVTAVSNNKLVKRIVYAIGSTDRFSTPTFCKFERQIIKDLAEFTKQVGFEFYLKPRPNGYDGEFDYLKNEYPHVQIGKLKNTNATQAADYFYSDDDNKLRFENVIDAFLVVNSITTFGVDSCVAGIPVLQLDLRKAKGYELAPLVQNNYHLDKYLLQSDNVVRVEGETLLDYLLRWEMKDLLCAASKYSYEIEQQFVPQYSLEDAVQTLCEAVRREC